MPAPRQVGQTTVIVGGPDARYVLGWGSGYGWFPLSDLPVAVDIQVKDNRHRSFLAIAEKEAARRPELGIDPASIMLATLSYVLADVREPTAE